MFFVLFSHFLTTFDLFLPFLTPKRPENAKKSQKSLSQSHTQEKTSNKAPGYPLNRCAQHRFSGVTAGNGSVSAHFHLPTIDQPICRQ